MDTGDLVDGTQGTWSVLKDTYEYKWLAAMSHFGETQSGFFPSTAHPECRTSSTYEF